MKRTLASLLLLAAGILIGFGYGRWYGPGSAAKSAKTEPAKPKGYFCPMHPNVRSDKPGDCPICGMKLIPEQGDTAASAAHQHTAAGHAEEKGPPPPGAIRVSAEKQQLIGVKFSQAEITSGTQTFRTVGRVSMDETRIAKVQTRIEGWIEKVFVDFTGKLVEKGQPLLTLYSPEMLASQQEYLLALRGREILKSSPLAGAHHDTSSLLAAARKRLELWDLSEEQIEQVTRTGKPLTNITLHAPLGGFVMMRNAFPKQRITPETELYTLADLSKVWIMADVFENEAPLVHTGMPVRINVTYAGGRKLLGRVNYIQPQIDMNSRTLKVRIEADNPGFFLKPEMTVDVEFQVGLPARITVPAEAVLDSGMKRTVFVDLGNGFLEPREVETGERAGGRIAILRGLKAGERVVTAGNFLIDSESQLKAAAAGMGGKPAEPGKPAGGAASEHKHD